MAHFVVAGRVPATTMEEANALSNRHGRDSPAMT